MPDRSHLAEKVNFPMENNGGGYRCFKATGDNGRGWLNGLMRGLNNTFPHHDHVLINMGVSGANWRHFAHGSCLEYHLPLSLPDLLILEHIPDYEDGKDPPGLSLELLLNRFRLHYLNSTLVLPPVICLNAIRTEQCADGVDADCLKMCRHHASLRCLDLVLIS